MVYRYSAWFVRTTMGGEAYFITTQKGVGPQHSLLACNDYLAPRQLDIPRLATDDWSVSRHTHL